MMNGIMKSPLASIAAPLSTPPSTTTTLSSPPPPPITKERKKHDRFNGMPEEEVSKRTLPDHLTNNLDIIIVSL